jgi:hypothetical protein
MLVAVIMVFQGITISTNNISVNHKPDLFILLSIALLMLVVLNISSYLHIKIADKSNSELKGYANKTMLYGILGGIVLSGLITFIILAHLLHINAAIK